MAESIGASVIYVKWLYFGDWRLKGELCKNQKILEIIVNETAQVLYQEFLNMYFLNHSQMWLALKAQFVQQQMLLFKELRR